MDTNVADKEVGITYQLTNGNFGEQIYRDQDTIIIQPEPAWFHGALGFSSEIPTPKYPLYALEWRELMYVRKQIKPGTDIQSACIVKSTEVLPNGQVVVKEMLQTMKIRRTNTSKHTHNVDFVADIELGNGLVGFLTRNRFVVTPRDSDFQIEVWERAQSQDGPWSCWYQTYGVEKVSYRARNLWASGASDFIPAHHATFARYIQDLRVALVSKMPPGFRFMYFAAWGLTDAVHDVLKKNHENIGLRRFYMEMVERHQSILATGTFNEDPEVALDFITKLAKTLFPKAFDAPTDIGKKQYMALSKVLTTRARSTDWNQLMSSYRYSMELRAAGKIDTLPQEAEVVGDTTDSDES